MLISNVFKKFDTRCLIYHVVLVFILVHAWKEIKAGTLDKNLKPFFKEAKSLEAGKEQAIAAGGIVLTLDSQEYHPEDKNFKYYLDYTGKELEGILGSPNLKHSGAVNCAAVSPDGRYIISGSSDHTLKLWDLETGKEIASCTFKIKNKVPGKNVNAGSRQTHPTSPKEPASASREGGPLRASSLKNTRSGRGVSRWKAKHFSYPCFGLF